MAFGDTYDLDQNGGYKFEQQTNRPRVAAPQRPTPQPTPTPQPAPPAPILPEDWAKWTRNMIQQHEGFEGKQYKDSRGYWTIGYGHRITANTPPDITKAIKEGRPISKQRAQQLFDADWESHSAAARNIPGFEKLQPHQKAILIDMTYNMGPSWFGEWKKLQKAILAQDANAMAREMKDSDWYNQVGDRSKRLIGLMQTGKIPFLGGKDFGYMPGEAVPVPRPDPTKGREPGAWDKLVQSFTETVTDATGRVKKAIGLDEK